MSSTDENVTLISDCYCPNCMGGHAETRLLPTTIPGFQQIIVMTLTCSDCHFRNSEVTFGGTIQPKGSYWKFEVQSMKDLNRQLLKSDFAVIKFPRMDLEIPPTTQRGVLTTIEGVLSRTREHLMELQPERLRLGDLENFHRCQNVIDQINAIIGRDRDAASDDHDTEEGHNAGNKDTHDSSIFPFQVTLDDPSGNSVIENPLAPLVDPQLSVERYDRTPTQDIQVGLQPTKDAIASGQIEDSNPLHKHPANTITKQTVEIDKDRTSMVGRDEAMRFPTSCSNCQKPTEVAMCVTNIPHFKDAIIMSMVCDHCGYKTNEIKGGGAIPERGCKIRVDVEQPADLSREVLKSASAGISIPELELELEEGGLDGIYTTVEGLLVKILERLELANPFASGDAATQHHIGNNGEEFSPPTSENARYQAILQTLQDMSSGKLLPFTLVVTDPLADSFVGPRLNNSLEVQAPIEDSLDTTSADLQLHIEEFERTDEQNERLGLNDIKVEGYGATNDHGTDRPVTMIEHRSDNRATQRDADHPRPLNPPVI